MGARPLAVGWQRCPPVRYKSLPTGYTGSMMGRTVDEQQRRASRRREQQAAAQRYQALREQGFTWAELMDLVRLKGQWRDRPPEEH